jgi:hypothetical protein
VEVSWEFGLRSRTVTATKNATTAENKPDYSFDLVSELYGGKTEDSRR